MEPAYLTNKSSAIHHHNTVGSPCFADVVDHYVTHAQHEDTTMCFDNIPIVQQTATPLREDYSVSHAAAKSVTSLPRKSLDKPERTYLKALLAVSGRHSQQVYYPGSA